MKQLKHFLTFLLLLSTTVILGQKFSKSINNSSIISLQATDAGGTAVTSLSENYVIEATKAQNGYFEIVLISSNDKQEKFSLYPLSFELFTDKFKKHFKKLIEVSEVITVSNTTTFNEANLSLIFAQLITFERTEENRPVVANITINEDIPVIFLEAYNGSGKRIKRKDRTKSEITKLNDAKLELTFYNGFIEKVELEAEVKGKMVRFTNIYSIGISSSNGIKKFQNHNISSFYTYSWDGTTLSRANLGENNSGYLLINFADIIDYDREIDINANDISPEPTKIILEQGIQAERSAELFKEESTKLFETVVYSDLFGVLDEQNPNGIVQAEIDKKFYINTDRKDITPRGRRTLGLIFFPLMFSEGYGFFEYIELKTEFSKIEENNKFLIPSSVTDELGNNVTFFEPLRIIQHQSLSIGADVNLLFLENQNKKINTNLDFGLRFGRSGLRIGEDSEEFYNTALPSLNLQFKIIPEKRYAFAASNRISYLRVYDDFDLNLKSKVDDSAQNPKSWFNTVTLNFMVNTSTTGKLFLRYRLISELENWDNNFSQLQFGYSFFLLRQNGKIL
ncbi:MAG: hypothetical protein HRT74_04975 [Flavobacteriales bacterium]|nr:hypothetical protein [Flavobacteriales bacterium]